MWNAVRFFIIRNITPKVWFFSPDLKSKTLMRFSVTEKDSAYRFMKYLPLIEDPKIKNDIFQHALEEFFHSQLFEKLALKQSQTYINYTIPPRKNILTGEISENDLVESYAYAFVGENEVNKSFEAYNSSGFDKETRKIFARIASDEKRHAVTTDHILLHLCKNDKLKYKKSYRNALHKRWYEEYSVLMNSMGSLNLNLILGIIYYIFGAFSFLSLKKRMQVQPHQELGFFKDQVNDSKANAT